MSHSNLTSLKFLFIVLPKIDKYYFDLKFDSGMQHIYHLIIMDLAYNRTLMCNIPKLTQSRERCNLNIKYIKFL